MQALKVQSVFSLFSLVLCTYLSLGPVPCFFLTNESNTKTSLFGGCSHSAPHSTGGTRPIESIKESMWRSNPSPRPPPTLCLHLISIKSSQPKRPTVSSDVARPEGCRNRSAGLQQHKGKAGLGQLLLVIELLYLRSVGNQLI